MTFHYDPKLSGNFPFGPKDTVTTYVYDSQGNEIGEIGE
jgi:hypothetical protein